MISIMRNYIFTAFIRSYECLLVFRGVCITIYIGTLEVKYMKLHSQGNYSSRLLGHPSLGYVETHCVGCKRAAVRHNVSIPPISYMMHTESS